MLDLRVELDGVKVFFLAADGADRAVVRLCDDAEAFRHGLHGIVMAHPADGILHTGKERAFVETDKGLSVFAHRRGADLCAEFLTHQLHAVADAEHRHAEMEQLIRAGAGAGKIAAVRSAGEDDAGEPVALHAFNGCVRREQLAVYAGFADAPRDELVILRSKIDDYDSFHAVSLIFIDL